MSTEKSFIFPTSDLALPKGSLILVTGATGYVASHIINEALTLGYKVRGTVRSPEKGDRVKSTFNNNPNLTTVIVSDLTDSHAFDSACDGADGVIHVASVVSFSPDPAEVVPATVAGAVNALKSSLKAGTVKRFVYTSSSVAATMPILDKEYTITNDTWNQAAVDAANALKKPFPDDAGYLTYAASKTEAERAVWKFVNDERPNFVVNCVLPNANFGKVIFNPPGITGSILPAVLDGTATRSFPPQWYVDVQDDARLHLAALLDKTVSDERVWAFAETWDWNDLIEAVKKARPDKEGIMQRQEPHGKDLSRIQGQDRAEELLRKWFDVKGWKSLDQSARENLEGL